MKKIVAAVLLQALVLLTACSGAEEPFTITGEQGLTPRHVAGVWENDAVVLTLREDATYLYKAESSREGGFITEGEYVVLDGYGVDDPEVFLSLRYDAEKELLTLEGKGGYTLSRVSEPEATDVENREAWYGTYAAEQGTIILGRGDEDNSLLVAITPQNGVTTTTFALFSSETEAFGDIFTLTLEENAVTLEGREEYGPLTGRYEKT